MLQHVWAIAILRRCIVVHLQLKSTLSKSAIFPYLSWWTLVIKLYIPIFQKGTELTSLNSTILYTNSPNLLVAGQDKAITQSCGGHVFGPSLCDPRGTWRKAHPQLGFFQVAEKTRKKVVNQGKPKSSLNISKPSPFLVVVYDQKGPLPVYPTDDHDFVPVPSAWWLSHLPQPEKWWTWSQLGKWIFPIWWEKYKTHVPNHQPGIDR